jgi:aryl-alcohol dehydrogenase-like predicted oxidoreductase
METIQIGTSGLTASRIALGTWAIGGWLWGGASDLDESVGTIRSAIERGITLIDTAPVYGFGRSEEIVGLALSGGLRDRAVIATKVGLDWRWPRGETLPRRESERRWSTRCGACAPTTSTCTSALADPLVPFRRPPAARAFAA